MEEEKKAGIIVDYAVYGAVPRSPHDPIVPDRDVQELGGPRRTRRALEPIERKLLGDERCSKARRTPIAKACAKLGSQLIRICKMAGG